jgi:hypothetical protein
MANQSASGTSTPSETKGVWKLWMELKLKVIDLGTVIYRTRDNTISNSWGKHNNN